MPVPPIPAPVGGGSEAGSGASGAKVAALEKQVDRMQEQIDYLREIVFQTQTDARVALTRQPEQRVPAFFGYTPAQITANQNDYNPGMGYHWYRLSSDAARTITGIMPAENGKIICLTNVGSFPITLSNQSGSSTAAYQIITGTGADVILEAGCSIELRYDVVDSRWRADFSGALTSAEMYRLRMLIRDSGQDTGTNVTRNSRLIVADGGRLLAVGVLLMVRMPVFQGQVITNISFYTDANNFADATNGCYAALFESESAGTPRDLIVQSAEVNTWNAGRKVFVLSAAHTVTAAQAAVGYLYAGVWVHASATGTMPDVIVFHHAYTGNSPKEGGTSSTALGDTAPDPAAAITETYQIPWCEFT